MWDGYYTRYKQKVYPVVRVDGWWYIFQKLRNPITRQWEGGTATRLTPTVFRLNPDLDPFKGDLLRQLVIRPIEDELDLLTEQVHEAPDDVTAPRGRVADKRSSSRFRVTWATAGKFRRF